MWLMKLNKGRSRAPKKDDLNTVRTVFFCYRIVCEVLVYLVPIR